MFHTLSELQEKEKNGKNKQNANNKNYPNFAKERTPEDNYYGKGNKAYDHYNQKRQEDNNEKFEKTKNKIKLVVYQNGFILNNGKFRDKSIPENKKFMEEVERGNIPQEIIRKGITDLGILLINRKTEIYYPPIPITPITHITQITQINPINPITVNPPINQFNQLNQFNQDQSTDIFNIQNYSNPYQFQYPIYPNQNQFQNQYQNPYMVNEDMLDNPIQRGRSRTMAFGQVPQTPMGNRNVRNNIYITNTEKRNDYVRKDRQTSSVPKKESGKFLTFHNFKQREYLKEEEEKKKKQKLKEKMKANNNKNEENLEKEEEKKEEMKKEEKKFTAFAGSGKNVGYVNIEGLNVDKDIKNIVDISKPLCSISIRLFNGEVVKCDFNFTQTLRDIYFYVRRISGSNNFTLLDGFPPKPLKDYDRTISELNLQNTTLTQKIH